MKGRINKRYILGRSRQYKRQVNFQDEIRGSPRRSPPYLLNTVRDAIVKCYTTKAARSIEKRSSTLPIGQVPLAGIVTVLTAAKSSSNRAFWLRLPFLTVWHVLASA
jgi:hypothetical protein